VALWARSPELAAVVSDCRENRKYAPGAILPECVQVTADPAEALAGTDLVLVAVPSSWLRGVMRSVAAHVPAGAIVVSGTKGLEKPSGKRMSEVIVEELGAATRIAALSGPNLSREIITGHPAVSVAASHDATVAQVVQETLSSGLFRVYTNCDILGVEICGALKNIIALGAGIADGLGYGDNAKAALITRGLAEMGRLGTRLGAAAGTFWGIAGVGDLVATCNSNLSRNWTVGWRLGRGETLERVLADVSGVAEGIQAAAAARALGAQVGVEMPITEAVYQVLFKGCAPADGVRFLMEREGKSEAEDWHWESAARGAG
jgi:glycerol-3-phosphate dehydrogenase (NAD(P)+)